MKTQTINSPAMRGAVPTARKPRVLEQQTTGSIVWYLVVRHRFELVTFYAVATTTAWIITNFNTAWQHFVR